MTPPVLEKDDLFHCSLISIQVENRLFKVPRELFEIYSEVFQDMFSLPRVGDSDTPQDGDQDDKPLFLDGIKVEEFRSFLKVLSLCHHDAVVSGAEIAKKADLLLTRFRGHPSMSNSCWISALRLSHIWGFAIVRAKVIAVLRGSTLGMIQRLNLANEFQITEWIRPAYQHLLTREESLKESDVPWLGPEFVANVTKAREERLKLFILRVLGRNVSLPNCPTCGKETLKFEVLEKSREQLQAGSSPNQHGESVKWALRCEGSYHSSYYSNGKHSWSLEELMEIEYNKTSALKQDVDRLIDEFIPIS